MCETPNPGPIKNSTSKQRNSLTNDNSFCATFSETSSALHKQGYTMVEQHASRKDLLNISYTPEGNDHCR